ncbi:hypothetical protein QEJ31_05655 [Pigmentibacter sp. JX0631]|uniref:hypothetical protein n=1 Tax=Pigmentibacter sp. JX0631 TaxID=2976982 RepID=UPI0024692788|nr:hypothetical protein [Pigmentibacter sp. JX0631]WGL61079.1 hypothetical protein QEJ31_05655 [Pigmentibacter sp. JX0631]
MLKKVLFSLIISLPFVASAKSILEPGETLVAGRVLQSPNLCFTLGFRDQGNLVITNRSGKVIWSSNTYNTFATQLYIDYGSNLKLLNSTGAPINWQTNTSGAFGFLRLQNDGNLVIYSDAFKPLWYTGSYDASCG